MLARNEKGYENIRQLATKPEAQLTRREDAQRQAIRAWAVLSEHGDVGETLLHDMAGQANDLFIKYFSAGEGKEEQSTTEQSTGT